jgi:hypothetical protein
MCTWPVGVIGPCHRKTAPCCATNQPYVNATMLFDPWHHVTQCRMLVDQSKHILLSHHLHNHSACCAHGRLVFWDPDAANSSMPYPNQQYVNSTMLFEPRHHVTQCSMVVEQSNKLLLSYHLHNHCACCGRCLWVYWVPVAAKQLHALPLTNNMLI